LSEAILIRKLDAQGLETFRYRGQVLARSPRGVLLEAVFTPERVVVDKMALLRGDRFVELYLNDRWYNILQMYRGSSPQIKGWYCNVARPAVFEDGQVSFIDLALDLLVYPDGRQVVLDKDEFEALALDAGTRKQALASLKALQRLFKDQFPLNLMGLFQDGAAVLE
jgi:uncharacterized protein